MAEFSVKFGLKTEFSENSNGPWDDSDRYLITAVRAETEDGAAKKAERFLSGQVGWEPGYTVVEVVNLDSDDE